MDHNGLTALHHACKGDVGLPVAAEATVRILIAYGAHVNLVAGAPSPATVPLCFAIDATFYNVVTLLLEAGADPNTAGPDGEPLLIWPAQSGETEVVNLMLEYGADVDSFDARGNNALLMAACYGYLSTVKLLVEKGADLRCRNFLDETPLTLAIRYGFPETAEYLMGLEGVDIMAQTFRGVTQSPTQR